MSTAPFPGFVYLASQSPRRRQLLEQIGVRHELLLPGAEEDAEALEALVDGESPDDYVSRVTAAKLQAALRRREARGLAAAPVLCSDTTVALGARILGKPDDADHALAMLASLSGREHRVLTAVAIGLPDGRVLGAVNVSQVRFAEIGAARLQAYVASGEPMGKAGAYAIQSQAAAWIEHIAGSYSGIMGLPLFETAQLLREAGFSV
ncbi:Maf family protein [Mitsuaria sp. GD03876]|uniref:Maf family protein n=1 Tax=Mitsuaria sp. GD03876 TaxID=2975399 RepID=UPI0024498943|nr:Maf family protein [Mitsuaria sp. GD03876]MDH0867044.1 Maf family nucleotide pyrophosphatase [Mitsuaria sp. GD03876]